MQFSVIGQIRFLVIGDWFLVSYTTDIHQQLTAPSSKSLKRARHVVPLQKRIFFFEHLPDEAPTTEN
jgi:hypothetical protein